MPSTSCFSQGLWIQHSPIGQLSRSIVGHARGSCCTGLPSPSQVNISEADVDAGQVRSVCYFLASAVRTAIQSELARAIETERTFTGSQDAWFGL